MIKIFGLVIISQKRFDKLAQLVSAVSHPDKRVGADNLVSASELNLFNNRPEAKPRINRGFPTLRNKTIVTSINGTVYCGVGVTEISRQLQAINISVDPSNLSKQLKVGNGSARIHGHHFKVIDWESSNGK